MTLKPTLRGKKIKASYNEPKVSIYSGNPLIEALPPIYPEEIAMELMRFHPPYCESWRNEPTELRLQYIMNLERFVEPLRKYRDLERLISRMIRIAYVSRNPIQVGYPREIDSRVEEFFKVNNLEMQNYIPNEPHAKATGFALIGISGVGKTTAIERIQLLYPQVIQHRKYNNHRLTMDQLVWLKLETPHNGSTKALCIHFFSEVDAILGTNYRRTHGNAKLSEEVLVKNMYRVALLQGIGLIVIDEIQHLSVAKSGGREEMLNFFTNLVNIIGVPVVLIGTPKAIKILTAEFRQTRRFSGYHTDTWDRLTKDDEWDYFIQNLWSHQFTKHFTPLTKELSNILYEETQGITDFVIKLFMLAQIRAIESGDEMLSPQIIRSAALDGFQLARPILNALKSNDTATLESFEDVYLKVQDYLESIFSGIIDNPNDSSIVVPEYNKVIAGIAAWLINADYPFHEAYCAAEKTVTKLGVTAPVSKLKGQALQFVIETQKHDSKNNTKTRKSSKKKEPKKQADSPKTEDKLEDNITDDSDGYNTLKLEGKILQGNI